MDCFSNFSTAEIYNIFSERRTLINVEIARYVKNTFFKNNNLQTIDCYYDVKNEFILTLSKTFQKLSITVGYKNNSRLDNKILYWINHQDMADNVYQHNLHRANFNDFDESELQCLLVYDCYKEIVEFIKELHNHKKYYNILKFIGDTFAHIYSSDYFVRLKNIMLILCQAKYHRSKFPIPYDIVKIIAHKLMKF
jgi:hypothetical protein